MFILSLEDLKLNLATFLAMISGQSRHRRPLLAGAKPKKLVLVNPGAYNPVSFVHLRMFERAKDYLEKTLGHTVIEGIFSPFSDKNIKPDLITSRHRLKMLQLATQNSHWIRVDDWQTRQFDEPSTLEVLDHFQTYYNKLHGPSEVHVMLLCGADIVESFASNLPYYDQTSKISDEDLELILSKFGVVSICRPLTNPLRAIYSVDVLRRFEKNIYIIDDETSPSTLSSTRLRTALRRNESIRYCTPDAIIEYIREHGLYKSLGESLMEEKERPESLTLDELYDLSTRWADYFTTELEKQYMTESTQSLPMPTTRDISPPKSPKSKSVSFAMEQQRTSSALSEPNLTGKGGMTLKFRQYNLSSTPETTV
ncbi:unnamed protein product [Bursaphelenchus xylophilus]|uniref:Nicotinamide-nucleotide adenylyltransferase n=1 Tax=Bursaphelenchus xylophilus TaxID=6326 RepID=A0A1I7SU40_BURXY|nr:unnamed protein product [Bursaphelenchus xylophilus]CAG9107597.1 unnamed protein product [Bursaphelenchus xylophilus]